MLNYSARHGKTIVSAATRIRQDEINLILF